MIVWEGRESRLVRLYEAKTGGSAMISIAAIDEPSLAPVQRRAKRRGFSVLRFDYDDLVRDSRAVDDLRGALTWCLAQRRGTLELHAIGTSAAVALTALMSVEWSLRRVRMSLIAPRLLERFDLEDLNEMHLRGLRSTIYLIEPDPHCDRGRVLAAAAGLDARVFGFDRIRYESAPRLVASAHRARIA